MEQYQPGNEEDILELLQLVFNGWPHFDLSCTPLEHWKWKFLENPISKQIHTVAVDKNDNRIIGCYLGADHKVKLIDDIHHSNQGVDLAVHPEFRRMGIWTSMQSLRSEILKDAGFTFGYWSSVNPIVTKSLKTSIAFPRSISPFVRVKNLDLHFKMAPSDNVWMKKIGYRILNIINDIFNASATSLDENIIIKEISKFDNRVDVFWEQISDDYSFIVERRQEYLNWRYCDPRGGDYHVLIAEEGGSLLGYCVYRINKYYEEYPRGYVVDLLTLSDRSDVSSALLQRAVEFFDESNVNIIVCSCKRESNGSNFRKLWFLG